jgi:hypothetical protein
MTDRFDPNIPPAGPTDPAIEGEFTGIVAITERPTSGRLARAPGPGGPIGVAGYPTATSTATPPRDPACRTEKSPRSMTARRGRDLPTTTRRPHASSVQTNSASEDVSASQVISWDAAGEGVQSAAIVNLSLGC